MEKVYNEFFEKLIVFLISGANKFAEMYHCKECSRGKVMGVAVKCRQMVVSVDTAML